MKYQASSGTSAVRTTTASFFPGTTLNIRVNCTLSSGYGPYTFKSINSVSSWLTGLTAQWGWTQQDYSYSIDTNKATIQVYGITDYYAITPLGTVKYWSRSESYSSTIYAQ